MIRKPTVREFPNSATLLLALLAVVLALAGLVAYEAVEAARSRRVTAERALQDDATFASWELLAKASNRVEGELRDALNPAIGIPAASPYDRLPAPQVLEASADGVLRCAGSAPSPPRLYFRLDLRDGSLATSGRPADEEERRWIADTLTREARLGLRPGQRLGLVGDGTGSGRVLAFGLKFAQYGAVSVAGAPVAAFGFETCRDAVGADLLKRVFSAEPLLPQAVSRGLPNDSLLTLSLLDPGGRVLYASRGEDTRYAHEVTMDPPASLRVRVGLRSSAASRLEVPVAPSSRLPLLLALLALAGGLAAIGLRQLRREHELVRMRSDFTSSVSHELRTPLAQILLYGETLMLERARSEEERRNAAETIVQEARRLMRLVDNVLHFARVDRDLATPVPEPILLAPRLRGILSSFLAAVPPGTLRLRTDLDERAAARVDEGALRQVVLNLLDNAVKYGPAGQTVTVSLARQDGVARIVVDDEGPGVPPDARERIWEPFVRAAERGRGPGGNGLGLAVVRELVQAHGGSAAVESGPQGGARFTVTVPACDPVEARPS
jgi:signal transduction histidine kinase